MDINLMVLNVGNSRLAIGVFSGGELQYSTRISHDLRHEWPGRIAEAWGRIKDLEEPPRWPRATVHPGPARMPQLSTPVQPGASKPVEWVGRDIDLPIKVLTDKPEQTGVDRVLNIAAAYEQLGKACVVVDAGSAITVDLCDERGQFLERAIAPGATVQLAALHEKTAKLPQVPLAAPSGAFGKSTESAIQQGVFHGIRGLVKELAENYATHLGSWPEVIATGGDAHVLFDGWEIVHAVSPDLTLYGIALAYANHYIKHGS